MLANIQMLRAWAAVLALTHHLGGHYVAGGGTNELARQIIRWGFGGVDVFFVISGFIVARTTLHQPRTAGAAVDFLSHRLGRIFLGYWPFFLVSLCLAVSHGKPADLERIDWWGSFFLTNADMAQALVPVSWSLTYELYFYGLSLLSFAFSARLSRVLIQLSPWVLAALTALIALLRLDRAGHGALHFLLSPFLIEFFAGACLFIHAKSLDKRWALPLLCAAAAAGLGWGMETDARNGFARVCAFGVAAIGLVGAAVALESRGIYRAGKSVVGIGNASYTVYLSHTCFITALYLSGVFQFLEKQGETVKLAGYLGLVAVIVSCSQLLYRWMERPLYRAFLRFAGRKREGPRQDDRDAARTSA